MWHHFSQGNILIPSITSKTQIGLTDSASYLLELANLSLFFSTLMHLIQDYDMLDTSLKGSRFENDLQRTPNECESLETKTTSVPFLWRPSILVCFNIPYLSYAKSNPAVVFQVYIYALPWQHFQSSTRHLCLSKRIAGESCKPILVLRQKSIRSQMHVRGRDNWNFDYIEQNMRWLDGEAKHYFTSKYINIKIRYRKRI